MSRLVTISTASILIDGTGYPSPCVQRAYEAVDAAGQAGADIVCLPEEFDLIGCEPEHQASLGEPIPGGEITETLRAKARQHGMYVIGDVRERDGEAVYNTAVVIGRDGEIVGKYRKTHLAPGEWDQVQAGDEYPVFETDFGVIGVLICMDIHYPEIWRILALKGADIIFWPTQCLDYTGDFIESLFNARAIDNQIYAVSAHFVQQPFLAGKSMGHARIVDPYGRTRASTSHRPGIATATVDLDEGYEYWVTGDLKREFPTLKETFFALRRPETYGQLCEPDTEQRWKVRAPRLYQEA